MRAWIRPVHFERVCSSTIGSERVARCFPCAPSPDFRIYKVRYLVPRCTVFRMRPTLLEDEDLTHKHTELESVKTK